MRNLKNKHRKAVRALDNFQLAIAEIDEAIGEYVSFDCAVIWQPGDGLCVLNGMAVTPLSACIGVIEKKGRLTEEDHENIAI